jgi:hypothetical protein
MTTKAQLLNIIRAKCLDCSCSQPQEVRLCPVVTCHLHRFRFGKDPDPHPRRGFAKTNGYTGNSEQQASTKEKPRREGRSRQGTSPKPITANDKDWRQ